MRQGSVKSAGNPARKKHNPYPLFALRARGPMGRRAKRGIIPLWRKGGDRGGRGCIDSRGGNDYVKLREQV
ncbi:MAG: hypothetical protein A2V86_06790 [Deltaproteobacteria bacterium RBG_16_49_23]|nr:MAG: hypothetical protein A2V86_06790 [Deltaproteobacteria bacterium RBG_16_49_23]